MMTGISHLIVRSGSAFRLHFIPTGWNSEHAADVALWLRHITDLERSAIGIAIPDFPFAINSISYHRRRVHPDKTRNGWWNFLADLYGLTIGSNSNDVVAGGDEI